MKKRKSPQNLLINYKSERAAKDKKGKKQMKRLFRMITSADGTNH